MEILKNDKPKAPPDIPLTSSNPRKGPIIPERFRKLIFLLLIGTPSLDQLVQILEQEDETQWHEIQGQLVYRTSNVNVVASLALATSATFLTTSPPSPIAAWDHPFPYLCALAGSVFSTLTVLSGLGLLAFLNTMRPHSVREMQTSVVRFTVIITLLTMPFLCLFACGLCAVVGCLVAVWLGNNTLAKIGVTCGFLWCLGMILVIFASLY